jgi:hypothetical protein
LVAVLAHQAPLKATRLSRKSRTNGPDPACTRGSRRLVTEADIGTCQDRLRRAGTLCGGGQHSHPDHPAATRQQNASDRQLDDHRPASEGQPAAAHRPTQARSYHANVPANRRTPRPPNGVEQQPGRSPDPTARLAPRAVERASTTFRRMETPLRPNRPSAPVRCSVVRHGRAASYVPGPARRNRVRPAECRMGSRLAGQAAPKSADRRASDNSAAE